MDLREVKNISVKMIENFINSLGLDGEFYASTCNCPIAWGKPKLDAEGEFLSPESDRLNRFLNAAKLDDKTKRNVNSRGLILVNSKYRNKELDPNLFVTLIHEMYHSNRVLMIYDAVRDDTNENAYNFDNGKFSQNTFDYDFSYVDASQELLKGNIDDSTNTIDVLNKKSDEELDDMEFKLGKRDDALTNQQIVDEALVELMAVLSYKMYKDLENGKECDIWSTIFEASNKFEGTDLGAVCKIILKHHDLELFGWMIDPIGYSLENIHYDFFKEYTKNDQDLLEELYNSDDLDIDSILGLSEDGMRR